MTENELKASSRSSVSRSLIRLCWEQILLKNFGHTRMTENELPTIFTYSVAKSGLGPYITMLIIDHSTWFLLGYKIYSSLEGLTERVKKYLTNFLTYNYDR